MRPRRRSVASAHSTASRARIPHRSALAQRQAEAPEWQALGSEGDDDEGEEEEESEWETDTDDEAPARKMIKPVFVPKVRACAPEATSRQVSPSVFSTLTRTALPAVGAGEPCGA